MAVRLNESVVRGEIDNFKPLEQKLPMHWMGLLTRTMIQTNAGLLSQR